VTPTLASPAIWAFTGAKVVLWVLVLTRITGLLASFPMLGSEKLPLAVRAALAVLLTTVIVPGIPVPAAMPVGIPGLLGLMTTELAIGLLMGTVVAWIMEAVAFAGGLMDAQMGFSFVQLVDPATSQPTSLSGALLSQMAALLLFVTGMHHQVILTLVDSYRVAPMGQGLPLHALELVSLIGQMLLKGFQLAFPVVAVLFLVDLVLGISGKFMPQLQLLQLSFPLKIAAGVIILGLLLQELGPWLLPMLEATPRVILKLVGA
jgi:flagellar biosynthetic protein FliR